MTFVSLLKLLGAGFVERELARIVHNHVTTAGYAALADKFTAGVKGCADRNADEVAQALTDALFSIH